MTASHTRNAAPANAGNRASEYVGFGRPDRQQATAASGPVQAFLADLRADYRRARLLTVSLECIGIAVSKNVWGVPEAMAARRGLPVLVDIDPYVADFLELVETKRAEHERRRKYRRAA